jgi:hypothetical protein
MSDKNPDLLAENLTTNINSIVQDNNIDKPSESIFKKISDNKIYIYISVGVIVIGLVVYYFYIKNKKSELALFDQTNQLKVSKTLQPQEQEYYLFDKNGNPVKVSKNVSGNVSIINQQPSQQEIIMIQKQMMEQQMMEQQMRQQQDIAHFNTNTQMQDKPKMKLEHPSNNYDSDNDINLELARIKANENENIAEHNLTHSELEEINKKLEMMNSRH